MVLITHTEDLEEALESFEKRDEFVTIDTEFLREETYWPQLCLVQIAGSQSSIIIDTLSSTLCLEPLFNFMRNNHILKVFHAARQDLEIFYSLMGEVPQAIFDTQIAAMVCGYGDQIGYEALVRSITGKKLDKSHQHSNWKRRPLSAQQLAYAQADVVYLRDIYIYFSKQLYLQHRYSWIEDELSSLRSSETYKTDPYEMWRKLKLKNNKPPYLARLRELTALRELEAIRKNLPRGRIIRDEILNEIAYRNPLTFEDLTNITRVSRNITQKDLYHRILESIEKANLLPLDLCPHLESSPRDRQLPLGHLEFIRVLLKICAEQHKVAERLIATNKDLESLLLLKEFDAHHHLLQGWRYEIFGKEAWELKEGKKGLLLGKDKISLFSVEGVKG